MRRKNFSSVVVKHVVNSYYSFLIDNPDLPVYHLSDCTYRRFTITIILLHSSLQSGSQTIDSVLTYVYTKDDQTG